MIANALAQLIHGLIEESLHLPKAVATANIVKEIAEDSAAVGGVAHLRVELQTIDWSGSVSSRGNRTGLRHGQANEFTVDGLHLVAVTHPDDGLLGNAGKETAVFGNVTVSTTEFPAGR